MLYEEDVHTDECYTIMWRESKYTLLHCSRNYRISEEALHKVSVTLKEKYAITLNATILGYDCLTSNDRENKELSLEHHPGFKKMVELLNKKSDDFKWWIIQGKNIYDYRKGLLWKYIESTDFHAMTRKQLETRVTQWAPLINEYSTLKTTCELQRTQLQVYMEETESLKTMLEMERRTNKGLEEHILLLQADKKNLRDQIINAGIYPVGL